MISSIKTPEELEELLKDEAAKYPECKDSYFGGIIRQKPDQTGCNWKVSAIEGTDWNKCIERLSRVRELYNLPDDE
jgi:hypothetical protein